MMYTVSRRCLFDAVRRSGLLPLQYEVVLCDLGALASRGVRVPCLGSSFSLESRLAHELVRELLVRELVVEHRADNAEQPGRLWLERAAGGLPREQSTARLSEHCCISVCVVNSQCAGRKRLNGHSAASRGSKVSPARNVQPSFLKGTARD